jgi:hypothetical protein
LKAHLHYGKNGAKLEGFENQKKIFAVLKRASSLEGYGGFESALSA